MHCVGKRWISLTVVFGTQSESLVIENQCVFISCFPNLAFGMKAQYYLNRDLFFLKNY